MSCYVLHIGSILLYFFYPLTVHFFCYCFPAYFAVARLGDVFFISSECCSSVGWWLLFFWHSSFLVQAEKNIYLLKFPLSCSILAAV